MKTTLKQKMLYDTGIWIEFSYYDLKSYPPETELYTVKGYVGFDSVTEIEYVSPWDDILKCFTLNHFYVTKWLKEDYHE